MPVAGTAVALERGAAAHGGRSSAAMTAVLALGSTVASFGLWSFVRDNCDELAAALRRTIEVSAIAIAGAFVIGLVLGAARAYRVPVVSQLAAVYVEMIRNTPILVQIFFLYYGLPQSIGPWPGVRLEAFTVAWLSVTIWGGAFNTENFRAGFEAVPARFREAGSRSASAGSRRS